MKRNIPCALFLQSCKCVNIKNEKGQKTSTIAFKIDKNQNTLYGKLQYIQLGNNPFQRSSLDILASNINCKGLSNFGSLFVLQQYNITYSINSDMLPSTWFYELAWAESVKGKTRSSSIICSSSNLYYAPLDLEN